MGIERSLAGKNALVTGSTSGIGLAIAKRLAAGGCNLGLNGFGSESEILRLVDQIKSDHDVFAAHYGFDLRSETDIYRGLDAAVREMGRIDILVNNAGIQYVSSVAEFPTTKWAEVIAVNLSAVFHCSKALIPAMLANGWGRIVNIASVHGLVGSINKSAYVAAKHGVVGLTKTIALENAQSGLTCNAICPGYADTEIIRKQVRDKAKLENKSGEQVISEMLADKHPTGQFIEPSEIAALGAFLCSNEASGITGSAISIDGGWSAH